MRKSDTISVLHDDGILQTLQLELINETFFCARCIHVSLVYQIVINLIFIVIG